MTLVTGPMESTTAEHQYVGKMTGPILRHSLRTTYPRTADAGLERGEDMPFTDITDHSFHRSWNSIEAVYGIMNSQRQMIYIGETNDLKHRIEGRALSG